MRGLTEGFTPWKTCWCRWREAGDHNLNAGIKTYKGFGSWLLLACLSHRLGRHRTLPKWQEGLVEVVAGQLPALQAIDWLPSCGKVLISTLGL